MNIYQVLTMHHTVLGSENATVNKTDKTSLSSESLHCRGDGGKGRKQARKDTVYQMRVASLEENEAEQGSAKVQCWS